MSAPKQPESPDTQAVPTEVAADRTVPTPKTSGLRDLLTDLTHLEYDAVSAYKAAVGKLHDVESKIELDKFMHEHQSRIEELSTGLITIGATPPREGDLKGVLTRGRVILADLLGDEWILKAMLSNETETADAYEEAARHQELTPGVRDTVERALGDARRHRAWIERRIAKGFAS